MLDPAAVILLLLPLSAFLSSFALCGRREPRLLIRRLAGLYAVVIPHELAALVAKALGIKPGYVAVSLILSLIPLAYCGLRGLAIYLALTIISVMLIEPWSLQHAILYTLVPPLTLSVLISPTGLRFLEAGIRAWADDDYSVLESIAYEKGVDKQVKWRVVCLEANGRGVLGLVYTGVHYGPFRGACSSAVPHKLLEKSGYKLVALHGCGSHELNISTREEAEKLINAIISGATIRKRCTPVHPVDIRASNGWRGFLLGCAEEPLLFVTNKKGIEDIPCDALPPEPPVVIDMHNNEAPEVDTRGLAELVTSAKSNVRPCEALECCWRLLEIPKDLASSARLCSNWALVLLVSCDGENKRVVVLPANNVNPQAALRYKAALNAEIVTIDDHSCVAMVAEGVSPLQWNEKLATLLRNELDSCKLERCSVSYASGYARVRVWGERLLEEVRRLLRRGVRISPLPFLFYLVSLLATLL